MKSWRGIILRGVGGHRQQGVIDVRAEGGVSDRAPIMILHHNNEHRPDSVDMIYFCIRNFRRNWGNVGAARINAGIFQPESGHAITFDAR